jgi:hypothetical protein
VLPRTKGMFPHGYDEGKALLRSGALLHWAKAPALAGKPVDLTRPFPCRGLGFVVSVMLDREREIGFIVGIKARRGLLTAYCFNRRDFPCVAVWGENRAIAAPPWNRRTQARGLEFSTNPIPVPRSICKWHFVRSPHLRIRPGAGTKNRELSGFAEPSSFWLLKYPRHPTCKGRGPHLRPRARYSCAPPFRTS